MGFSLTDTFVRDCTVEITYIETSHQRKS